MRIFPKKLFLTLLAIGLLVPVFNAQAGVSSWLFEKIAFPAVRDMFAFSLYIVFSWLGTLMGALVQMLAWAVNLRIYTNVPILESSWGIMRDFANMLFIIALVVMAYGTIFNVRGYDFRSLIPRFIVIAVLINFSLVLGGLMIDATQVLNNTFLNAMGDISGRLGQGLEVWKLLPEAQNIGEGGEALGGMLFSTMITLLFGIFMSFVIVVSVVVPLVIAIVRIPVLWALLIVSPMAWLLSILPATKRAYDQWWHQFLAWNLFLPYYLFFLYFALFFLSRKDEVLASLGQTFVNDKVTGLEGLQSDFTFGLIFYYVLIAVFLLGGTKVAMSAGRFSGTGIINIARGTRTRAATFLRRAPVPYLGSYEATERAAKQRFDQLQKEGLPGRFGTLYGGERALERQTAMMAERFGVTGARDVQMIKEIGELKSKFARITDPEQLRSLKDKGRTQEKLAIREIMKDRNLLTSDELLETYEVYGGNRSLAGKQFARSVNYDKLSPQDREKWLQSTRADIETQQKILGAMADKGDAHMRDPENIRRALDLFALEGEKKDFLKKIEKKNIRLATELQVELGLLQKEGRTLTDLNEALELVISRLKPDDLLEATRTLTDPRDQAIRNVVAGTLNQQKLESILSKGTQEQVTAWQNLSSELRPDIVPITREEAQRRQAEAFGRAVGEAMRGQQGGGGPPPSQPPPGAPPAAPGPRRPAGFVRPDEQVQRGNVVNLRGNQNQENQ